MASFAIVGIVVSTSQTPDELIEQELRATFGLTNEPRFQFVRISTKNAGVGTLYGLHGTESAFSENDASSVRFGPRDLVCVDWECLGESSEMPESGWVDFGGFARARQENRQRRTLFRDASASAAGALDALMESIGLRGEIAGRNVVKAEIAVETAYSRSLKSENYAAYIRSLPESNQARALFEEGRIVVVGEDVVITRGAILVEVGSGSDGAGQIIAEDVDVRLGSAATENAISLVRESFYRIEINRPTVVLRAFYAQPTPGVLSGDEGDWKDWRSVKMTPD